MPVPRAQAQVPRAQAPPRAQAQVPRAQAQVPRAQAPPRAQVQRAQPPRAQAQPPQAQVPRAQAPRAQAQAQVQTPEMQTQTQRPVQPSKPKLRAAKASSSRAATMPTTLLGVNGMQTAAHDFQPHVS